jgi:hypothetical protein
MPLGKGGWLQSAAFDWGLILATPLFALLLGFAFSQVPADANQIFFIDQPTLITSMAMKAMIHSHLVIVFFRSHGNARVRRQHPIRFYLVPIALFLSMYFSLTILAIGLVVSTYWDTVHSSLQTFGIGRIYDMKAGADVNKGRQLDIWLNHYIYVGPFLCGPVWIAILQIFDVAERAGLHGAHELASLLAQAQPVLFWIVVGTAPVYLACYVWHVVKRAQAGEKLSWQKYVLFATTAVASIWAWGFNSFGQALLVVNAFHAVQYFAIVWWSEKDNLGKLFGTAQFPFARAIAAAGLVVAGVGYGFWIGSASDYWATHGAMKSAVLSVTNTVALLHFWYDGFVWSVRKKEVG